MSEMPPENAREWLRELEELGLGGETQVASNEFVRQAEEIYWAINSPRVGIPKVGILYGCGVEILAYTSILMCLWASSVWAMVELRGVGLGSHRRREG
jgi:hypothetical protein